MRETTMLRRLLLPLAAAAGAVLSVGCASPPAAQPGAPAAGDAQRVEPSRPVAKSEPVAGDALPPVTLTSALLYRIMAAEVAVQRGELGAAFATFVAVAKVQFAAILIVAVFYIDKRLAEVRQAEEQLLLDLLKLARGDFIQIGITVVAEGEEFMLHREFGCQKLIDERHIIIELTHLEQLLAP